MSYGTDREFMTVEIPRVFFADANNNDEIDNWSWNSTEGWKQTILYGDAVMKSSSPSAIMENGAPAVYMADETKNDEIDQWK
jgi:hypothetical protein